MHDEKPTAEHRLSVCEGLLRKAEAEVARLRELAEHRGKSLVKQLDATLAETRAHEATKARADLLADAANQYRERAAAAEARVAELESELKECQSLKTWHHGDCETAIDQARGLLELFRESGLQPSLAGKLDDWLRAHPAIATPAATGAEQTGIEETWEARCKRMGLDKDGVGPS